MFSFFFTGVFSHRDTLTLKGIVTRVGEWTKMILIERSYVLTLTRAYFLLFLTKFSCLISKKACIGGFLFESYFANDSFESYFTNDE